MPTNLLEIEQISYQYSAGRKTLTALQNFSAQLPVGAKIALLGDNGSGKSTLLRLLNGFLSPSSGRIRLLGRDLGEWPAGERAKHIATVGQKFVTDAWITVHDLVSMGRYPHLGAWRKLGDSDEWAIDQALLNCGLSQLRHRAFHQLSSGQQQLCLLARAMAQQSDLLLLDEPTAHLDRKHTHCIIQALNQLNGAAKPTTIIFVTHDWRLAKQHFNDFWYLESGRQMDGHSTAEAMDNQL